MSGNAKHSGKGWPLYGSITKVGGPRAFYTPRTKGAPAKPNPLALFEAVSHKPNGIVHRTRHQSDAAAQRRLAGNPRHSGHHVVDHTPRP